MKSSSKVAFLDKRNLSTRSAIENINISNLWNLATDINVITVLQLRHIIATDFYISTKTSAQCGGFACE
jgi:hypothetical protein